MRFLGGEIGRIRLGGKKIGSRRVGLGKKTGTVQGLVLCVFSFLGGKIAFLCVCEDRDRIIGLSGDYYWTTNIFFVVAL